MVKTETHRKEPKKIKKHAFLRSAVCTDQLQYPVGFIETCAVSESLVIRCLLCGILIQLRDKSIKKISPDGGGKGRRVAGFAREEVKEAA